MVQDWCFHFSRENLSVFTLIYKIANLIAFFFAIQIIKDDFLGY